VRISSCLIACVATTLATIFLAGPAAAAPGGGVAAPAAGGASPAASGGSAYGSPAPKPAAKKRSRRAPRKRAAAPRPKRPAAPVLPAGDHVFPVLGSYSLGVRDAAFGAPRQGHRHMGQDIAAARGTAVVAPFAGEIDWVRYQRNGAGYYVVLDADDERDYVFMHLKRGSILVEKGQRVAAGEQLAEVGNTGRSFGAHLHFEVWVSGWYEKGGEPVDPLPLLESWATR
jgi:murein DD-endopeptidase MepM/ murein hydrolase activator NlpD